MRSSSYSFRLGRTFQHGLRSLGLCAVMGFAALASFATGPNPVPLLNQPVSPASVGPGTGAFTLTVTGTGFFLGSTVNWNGTLRTTTFIPTTPRFLTASISAADVASAGTARITVVNPAPGGGTSNVVFFPITASTSSVVTFAPPPGSPIAVGTSPYSVVVADFNGDGKQDFVVVNRASATLSILLGNGDGTFTEKLPRPTAGLSSPTGVAVGDFNGDGIPDLAVSNAGVTGTVSIFQGDGTGAFSLVSSPATGANPSSVSVGDFNGDGNLDLAVANTTTPMGTLSILLGDGTGHFSLKSSPLVGTAPLAVGVGDFNRDGILDLAVVNQSSNTVSILIGLGDGTFSLLSSPATGSGPQSVAVADFNRDGILDLAVGGSSPANPVSILLGVGDGTFAPKVDYATGGSGPTTVAVGDFNGDGNLDLAVTNNGSGNVSILLGGGIGTFSLNSTWPAGFGAFYVAVGDFNGDGRLDLVVPDVSVATASILMQDPIVSLSTTSFSFGPQLVGTTSAPSPFFTLTNTGSAPLTFAGVPFLAGANPGDFAKTGVTCTGPTLAPGSGCSLSGTFTPTAVGARSATLNITDNANNIPGSTQTITLSGTGTAPLAGLAPSSLGFGAQLLGTTSSSMSATLSNTGTAALTITSISTAGDFAQTNTCGGSLAVSGSCTFTVTFTPTALGARIGSITVTDNSGGTSGSTQTVNLSGTGIAPVAGVAPGSLSFGNQTLGTTSASMTATLTNSGTATLSIASIVATGDFAQTNTCGSSLAPGGASCSITVTFTPTALGARTGSVTVTDNSNGVIGSTQSVTLTGAGIVNPVPLINQPLAPDAAPPAGTGFTLTVNGTGFVSTSIVNWKGSPRTTSFVSSKQLTAIIGSGDIAVAGTAAVTVVNPTPGGGTSNAVFFPVTNPTASVSFVTASSSSAGVEPFSVAVGDFNGDGKPDLAIANYAAASLTILLGNGDGTFTAAASPATGANPIRVAVGDFNGDGRLDLAVANAGNANLTILLGNGDGTFTPAASPATGPNPYSVAVGDFNGDGKLDLAVANEGSASLTILLGNGDGTFTPAASPGTSIGPIWVAVGDFNGDGKLDLVVTNYFSNNLTILLGNGDGTFTSAASPATGPSPYSVAVGDFNGDGKLDLAVTIVGSSTVTIFLGDGAGNFTPFASPATGATQYSVAVGDFNGDGKLDLAVANQGSNSLTILLGDGTGNFTATASPFVPGNPISVAVGDFNGDGRLDLAVADFSFGAVSILLQAPVVSLSSTSLTFPNQNTLGVTSAPQTVTVTNSGSAPLAISSVVPAGDFAVSSSTCSASVSPGGICTFDVTFTPTAHGTRTGSITLTDNANPTTQIISLSGTSVSGATPVISASSVSFGPVADGTTSPPQTVTLTNTGSGPMGNIIITAPPGFIETDTCGTTLAVGASCTITITADPKAPGAQGGSLTITSDAAASPQTVTLSDIGTVAGASQIITTFAGGGPNNVPATLANLNNPVAVVNYRGNLFIVAQAAERIYKVDPSGVLTVVAGNGVGGFSGDGGPATSASLNNPQHVAVDSSGNLFFADTGNERIRRVDATTGVISTVAGNGDFSFSGDGGPATAASLNFPNGIAVDGSGNLFIADTNNERIREVTAGIINTVAGTGAAGFGGDGGPATSAFLSRPEGVAVDASGNLFIADADNHVIREVTGGIINTVAGIGPTTFGFNGDGGPATSAELYNPQGVAVDSSGNFFIADTNNQRIREVSAGVINTVAGNGTAGFSGDTGSATSASLNRPLDVAVDSSGNLFIADSNNLRVREVAAGIINTVAGNGSFTMFGGDGSPATGASLDSPQGVTLRSGNLFISDTRNSRIRRVDATTGIITTVAGNGTRGFSGDAGLATSANLNLGNAAGVAVDASGNVFFADSGNQRIREVVASTGVITTVAGGGSSGLCDGCLATSAELDEPSGIALDSSGNLFIADTFFRRIRRVDATTGIITTVAGGGPCCSPGEGGPATDAFLNEPISVAVDGAGNLFIADNNRIRRVDASTRIITTVAGGGSPVFPDIGDGGPATSAQLNFSGSSCECTIGAVVVDGAGNLYIADTGHKRIRRVDFATSIITTVAGNGVAGFSGDGGLATSASLDFPSGVAVNGSGTFFIADSDNNRIRRVGSPQVSLSTSSLSFGTQLLGTSSAALPVSLSNPGGAPMTISSIVATGDFTETDTCPISPATLAIGASCTISVTFTPAALGLRSGTVSISDNAAASPQTITLSGTGVQPAVSLSASSLSFGTQMVATTSAPQTVTVTNSGTATLNIASITPSGDFAITGSTCGATLAAGATCSFGVTFTPIAVGARAGSITLTDDAPTSPQTIALSGTGVSPAITLSATTLTFSNQRLGTTSAAQTVTVTSSGTAPLNIASITPSGDFAVSSDSCTGSSVAPGSTCTFNVTFTPTALGARAGTITITDNVSPGTQTIGLSGAGIGNPVPQIYQPLAPESVVPGGAGFTLIVNGTGFVSGATVKWNGSARTTTFVSGNQLTATISAADVATAGTASVTVVNPTPGGGTSNPIFFTVTSPTSTLTFANAPGSPIAAGINPFSIAEGDFNGDGKLDLAVANQSTNKVTILLGNGDGTFTPTASSPATGTSPRSVAVGDFNGDGRLDLAVANNADGTVTILLGDGTGNFTATATSPATGLHPRSVAVGDFNGDGNLDLAIANEGSNNVTVLLGNGDGTFTPSASSPLAAGIGPSAVSVGDFDRDGKLDLAIANSGDNTVTIWRGLGDGNFDFVFACGATPCSPSATGRSPQTVAVADLNGDGKLDLAVANFSDSTVTILLGNGNGTFTATASSPGTGVSPRSVAVADFNGDGKLDLAVANDGDGTLTVLLGDGTGHFATAASPATGLGPHSVVAGDFNGDGRLDLATANFDSSTASILLQVGSVSLSPTSLIFASRLVGTTSPAQTVTLTNNGSASLTVSAIGLSGTNPADFAQTNTCGSLPATILSGSACTASVTFTPSINGAESATLTFTDNNNAVIGSTQTVSLTGAGTAPVASVAPASLGFGNQLLSTTSASQTATLSNTGTAALTIASIVASGDFAQTNTCGSSLAAAGSCVITVTFTPTATGARTGSITLTDNASPTTQTITLSGAGVIPVATLSAPSLTFSDQIVSTTSAAQTVTLTNTGTATLAITGIVPSGDFAETNTCGGSVAPAANCTLSVRFTPTATGLRTGSITITDNASPSPQTITLNGTGTPSASVTLSATSLHLPDTHAHQICHPLTVTVTSSGSAALVISSFGITGPFTQSNSCPLAPATLAAGASCTVAVTFVPTTVGNGQTGTLTIASNAASTPDTVALAGNGKAVCLIVPSARSVTVLRGADTATFSLQHQTGGAEAEDPLHLYCMNQAPASCAFNPGSIGPMGVATLTLSNLKAVGSGSLLFDVHGDATFDKHTTGLTVLLSDFGFTSAPDTATIAAGQAASYAVVVAPQNGLAGTVSLACSGAPVGATCSVTPGTVSLTGTAPASVTVTVSTTARSLAAPPSAWRVLPLGGNPIGLIVLAMLGLLAGLFSWKLAGEKSRTVDAVRSLSVRRSLSSMRLRLASAGAGLTIAMVLAWGACGGGGSLSGPTSISNSTPAGTYSLTVTGTYSGALTSSTQLSHSTALKLTVN